MFGVKRFFTFGRTLNFTVIRISETPYTKKYVPVRSYNVLSCDFNLNRKLKNVQNNCHIFKYGELQPVANLKRFVHHQESMPDEIPFPFSEENFRMKPLIFTFHYDSIVTNEWMLKLNALLKSYKCFSMRMFTNFTPGELKASAEQFVKLVLKLIAQNRLDELKDLMTTECFSKFKHHWDNLKSINKSDLEISTNDLFMSAKIRNLVFIQEENQIGIKMSLSFHAYKGIAREFAGLSQELKRNDWREYVKQVDALLYSKTFYIGEYRMIKWLHEEKTDWSLDGINLYAVDFVESK